MISENSTTNPDKNQIHNENIEKVSKILKNGDIFVIPTETVYGLAANALDDEAVAKIFEAKGRPTFNPLIVHVSDILRAKEYVEVSETAQKLAEAFWPGPLTLVLPKKPNCPISNIVSAGLDTLALRAPNHPIAQAILGESKLPLAAPSANISGTLSPTKASHITSKLKEKISGIIDGGPCQVGLESTIAYVEDDKITILRMGSISREDLIGATGLSVNFYQGDEIKSPGLLTRHYAPNSPIRINAFGPQKDEFMIGFGAVDGDINLSLAGNLSEAAANLFQMIREADQSSKEKIAVAPIPFEGIGFAINDRLSRASENEK